MNFIYPVNVLSNYSVISFAGLHTLIYHAVMVFVALLMLFSGYYRFRLRDCALAFLPVLVVSIPANIVNLVYHCDYMFFGGGFFPFSLIADHLPDWLWVIVLYAGYFAVPLLFFYLPAHLIGKRKERREPGCLKAKASASFFCGKVPKSSRKRLTERSFHVTIKSAHGAGSIGNAAFFWE